jgi:glutamate 5-kinase
MGTRDALAAAQRIVIKVGSSSLTEASGRLDNLKVGKLVGEMADAAQGGRELILVSSGAIAAGMGQLGLAERPKTIPEKQALAAIGQVALMHLYASLFAERGMIAAQVLLTREDMLDRLRCRNSRTTFAALLGMGALPVVNENDAVAVDEIKIGENDSLSAMVASLVEADLLIILTDIQGLYIADPRKHPEASIIHTVEEISASVEAMAGYEGSARGTGGMATKVKAAKIATSSGIPVLIADSGMDRCLQRLLAGEELGTLFLAHEGVRSFRKRWISFGAKVSGRILVDQGAERSLLAKGSSLLPAGITAVEGSFEEGDVVSVASAATGRELGRGVVNYSSEDIERIKGRRSDEIGAILGYKAYDEAIHRDHLALLVIEGRRT